MEFTSIIKVEPVRFSGEDSLIAAAARVSTGLDLEEYTKEQDAGLINYLMKNRHGSPFEHNSMTFLVEAPIYVFREFMRHRIGWSYNEVSGRYKKLEPKFYIYPEDRPLEQAGSGAHPKLMNAGGALMKIVNGHIVAEARSAWRAYEEMLHAGAANEVARTVLPVGIYSQMYVTGNARSIMSFLSLRIDHEDNTFQTKPLWEIQQLAEQIEFYFAYQFPATHAAWIKNGRIAP